MEGQLIRTQMYSTSPRDSGGFHRPREAGEDHAPFCPGARAQSTRGLWEGVLGVGAKQHLWPEGKSLHFHSPSLSFPTSKRKEAGLDAL